MGPHIYDIIDFIGVKEVKRRILKLCIHAIPPVE